ncbi:MAG: hypothetical protein M5U34_30285 [Chloroflexi bacterium]|nr:hypothetical protein [Chloroflexota bacterium]
MVLFLIRDVMMAGERFTFAFSIILLIWVAIWLWLGKLVWQRWQYYAAGREIMFINKDRLILRRPVTIWGLTDAFDMAYVQPFTGVTSIIAPPLIMAAKRFTLASI